MYRISSFATNKKKHLFDFHIFQTHCNLKNKYAAIIEIGSKYAFYMGNRWQNILVLISERYPSYYFHVFHLLHIEQFQRLLFLRTALFFLRLMLFHVWRILNQLQTLIWWWLQAKGVLFLNWLWAQFRKFAEVNVDFLLVLHIGQRTKKSKNAFKFSNGDIIEW